MPTLLSSARATVVVLLALLPLGLLAGCGGWRGAPRASARLAGTWQAEWVQEGLAFASVSTFRPDGTFTTTVQSPGLAPMTVSGTWTYKDGIITSHSAIGFEQDTVTWLNDNQVRSTCVACSNPDAVGVSIVSTRVDY